MREFTARATIENGIVDGHCEAHGFILALKSWSIPSALQAVQYVSSNKCLYHCIEIVTNFCLVNVRLDV